MASDSLTKIIPIKSISVRKGRRSLDESVVQELMKSICKSGLLHPIVVFRRQGLASRYVLVAGAHRLKALERLDLDEVAVKVIKRGWAEVAELAENLHRNDLNVLERAEYLTRYAKALAKRGEEGKSPSGGAQPHDLGISKIARQTRLDRRTISAAFRHSRLPKSVKSLLASKGLADNFQFICGIDKLKSEKAQISAINKRCRRSKSPAKPVVDLGKASKPSEAFSSVFRELRKSWRKSEVRLRYRNASVTVRKAFCKECL